RAPRDHGPRRRPAAEEGAAQVDAEEPAPLLVRHLLHGRLGVDRGAGDQRPKRSPGALGRGERRRDGVGLADVAHDRLDALPPAHPAQAAPRGSAAASNATPDAPPASSPAVVALPMAPPAPVTRATCPSHSAASAMPWLPQTVAGTAACRP